MDAARSSLLVIDLQAGLLPVIRDGGTVLANAVWLMKIAARLGVPCVITEQYPAGLGPSAAEVLAAGEGATRVDKIHFSAVADGCLASTAVAQRPQVVVCGTESHVCVLQTVLDLLGEGKAVFVVEDAVGSRAPADMALATARMRAAGAVIVSREMVAFEWLGRAGNDVFREINQTFIR
ncbi:MAG: isochorismatase family protein [Rhodocyclaceae bacterium]|nr:isochorismatase family protein [Rhodocyclaceae bacterium]